MERIEIDFGSNGEKSFSDFDEMQQWFRTEQATIRNLLGNGSNGTQAKRQFEQGWSAVDQAIQSVQKASGGTDTAALVNSVVGHLTTCYQNRLFLTESPEGRFLLSLKETNDNMAATAAAAILGSSSSMPQNWVPTFGNLWDHKGLVESFLFEKGLPSDADAIQESLQAIYIDSKKQLAAQKGQNTRLKNSADKTKAAADQLLEETRKQHQEILGHYQGQHKQQLEGQEKSFESTLSISKESLKELLGEAEELLKGHEQTYKEKLALHSSVKYWSHQAKTHLVATRWTAFAFTIGLLGAAYLLQYFASQLVTGEITAQKIAAVFLTASPIFWGLRVIARLLLSRIHLFTDASERQTMIKTYLALHNEGKIEDDQREFLLASIFRPSSTGIVRDDAAPGWHDLLKNITNK